jgi:hypothetical protein
VNIVDDPANEYRIVYGPAASGGSFASWWLLGLIPVGLGIFGGVLLWAGQRKAKRAKLAKVPLAGQGSPPQKAPIPPPTFFEYKSKR